MATRILVVEDDETTRELILEHLSGESDFEVVAISANGAEALPLVERHRPDVVLMDLSLPGLNGLKATKLIRKKCPNTAVIILSNYELDDLRDRPMQFKLAGASCRHKNRLRAVEATGPRGSIKPYCSAGTLRRVAEPSVIPCPPVWG